MPYNTRRKSLSLPSLGIQLPHTSRASTDHHTAKKIKRSPSGDASPSRQTNDHTDDHHDVPTRLARRKIPEDTPPPSPLTERDERSTVDVEGISDEIVVGVIRQLEATGNKPQLVKELAAALCDRLSIVGGSANPQAIISSRLNTFLKRPWTALAPCPLAKTLVPSHPRRIYFYLTTIPQQPFPSESVLSPDESSGRRVITPSLSSEEDEERKRSVLSPSPEVDLSPAEEVEEDEDHPPTPHSFGGSRSVSRDGTLAPDGAAVGRVASPPLEGDEREFEQTASSMQSKRSHAFSPHSSDPGRAEDTDSSRYDVDLFDQSRHTYSGAYRVETTPRKDPATSNLPLRSHRKGEHLDAPVVLGSPWAGMDTRSPETVELSELDDLLDEI